jgi:hypothetical protein
MYQLVATAALAAFTALNPGLLMPAQSPTPSPSPSVSAVPSSPILSQQASGAWTTTVVLQASDLCISQLSYELVTTPQAVLSPGEVRSHHPIQGPGASLIPCPSPTTTQAEEVTLAFTLASPPLAATLVIVDDHDAHPAAPAAIAMVSVHRFVSGWQYLWWPIISGALLALVFAIMCARFLNTSPLPHDGPGKGPARPIYASATWTFKDSWATNISLGATAVAAILTGAGAVSTQLPGVQLDRYAILMAICGVIIASAPFVFGILYTRSAKSRGAVPDNAELRPGTSVEIKVPGGASLTFPSQETNAKDPFPVTPGSIRTGRNITPVMPGDGTIVLKKTEAGGTLSVVAPPGPADPAAADDSVQLVSPVPLPTGHFPFVTIKVAGFATMQLPDQTTVQAPDGTLTTFRRATMLRVPLGSNVIVADFRSLIPAALVTMFGIGAQLGILGVLAFSLSNRTASIRGIALALVSLMALTVLVYAIATTRALADSTPGSALAPDSSTAATL